MFESSRRTQEQRVTYIRELKVRSPNYYGGKPKTIARVSKFVRGDHLAVPDKPVLDELGKLVLSFVRRPNNSHIRVTKKAVVITRRDSGERKRLSDKQKVLWQDAWSRRISSRIHQEESKAKKQKERRSS